MQRVFSGQYEGVFTHPYDKLQPSPIKGEGTSANFSYPPALFIAKTGHATMDYECVFRRVEPLSDVLQLKSLRAMTFLPRFSITNTVTAAITEIERARGFLEAASLSDEWISSMRSRAFLLEAHHTTHIEGTRLTVDDAAAILAGRAVSGADPEDTRELLNYRDAFEYVSEYLSDGGPRHGETHTGDTQTAGWRRAWRLCRSRRVPPGPELYRQLRYRRDDLHTSAASRRARADA